MIKTTQKTIPRSANLKASYNSFEFKDEIDYNTYRLIMNTFHIEMLNDMMENGTVYKLPFSLGIIGCFQRSTFGKGVLDYKLFNETGIYRYIKNNHTEGRSVRFVWDNHYFNGVPNNYKGFYTWKAPRDTKRKLATLLKSDTSVTIYNHLNE